MRVQANALFWQSFPNHGKILLGNPQVSYFANIMQDKGTIIDTLRLNEEQFSQIEANQSYTITADFGTGRNGGYLRVVDIVSAK